MLRDSDKPDIDLGALDEFVANDEALRQRLFAKFFVSSDETLASLVSAWQKRAIDDVRMCAHKLKSGALIMGANHLGSLCATIESASLSGDWEKIDAVASHVAPALRGFADKVALVYGATQ